MALQPGDRYAALIVQAAAPRKGYWRCQCDCGRTKIIYGSNITHGRSTSCGCRRDALIKAHSTTHGMSDSREYKSWCGAIARCTRPNIERYGRYGGRGIQICARWRSSFENFYADLGPCPTGHSLDRIDNDKPYEPGNCRWATAIEQQSHTSRSHYLDYQGEKLTIAEWARRLGWDAYVLSLRLGRGWSVEEALTTPQRFTPKRKPKAGH